MNLIVKLVEEFLKDSKDKSFYLPYCLTKEHKQTIYTSNHYKIEDAESIVALFDETIFGSAKVGVVLTDKAVYFADGNTKSSFKYSELNEVEVKEGMLASRLLVNSKEIPIGALTKEQGHSIKELIKLLSEQSMNESKFEEKDCFAKKRERFEYSDTEGKHHCTTCGAEGNISKTYSRGSLFMAILLFCAGGIPAFLYVFFYMKNWDGCSECKGINLVELGKWRKNNPKALTEEKNDEVA